jgi:hypothetical protein
MANADFKVILTIDSQGNVKIQEVKKGLEDVGAAAEQANKAGAAGAEEFAIALIKKVGIIGLAIAALCKLQEAAVEGFKAGIKAVDEFKLTTIGVAATMTDLADSGVSAQMAYARNIAYSKDMYNELELAAARHFASGTEMVQAWNILTQKGIVLKKEEIDSLGVIVDKVKLATQGQVQGIQIAQELRAMLSGQARATDQMAMILKDRYGAAWEDILKKHRESGDLITWLAQEFKGLVYAGADIQDTLLSQKSTLETLLTQVGRGGLSGAYADIVGWLREMNDYLRDHREEISGGINRGWVAVKELVEGVYGFIQTIANLANKGIVIPITFSIGGMSKWLATGPEIQALAEGYLGGVLPSEPELGQEAKLRQNQELAAAAARYKAETFALYAKDLGPPPMRGSAKESAGGGGGGKGRDTAESLEALVLQLRQEEARLTEGVFAGIEAWYDKISAKIHKLAMDEGALQEAMTAARELKAAKTQKAEEDFQRWYLGQMHQTVALQELEDNKRLANVKGRAAEEARVREVIAAHALERSQKLALEQNQQAKSYIDLLAATAPLVEDQYRWKERSLFLDIEARRVRLDQWLTEKHITGELADQYRALLSLANQSARYHFEAEKEEKTGGFFGGMRAWAMRRQQSAILREGEVGMGFMTNLESMTANAFSSGLKAALGDSKMDFKKFVTDAAMNFGEVIVKWGTAKGFDFIGGLLGGGKEKGKAGPAGTLANPYYVVPVGAQGLGGGMGGLGASFENLWGAFNYGEEIIEGGAQDLMTALDFGSAALDENVLEYGSMFVSSIEGLTNTADTFGGVFGSFINAISGLFGGGGGGILETIMGFLAFHQGGVLAHQGLLVAHGGLNLAADERLIIGQTGEGILSRRGMAGMPRDWFEALNRGDYDLAGPALIRRGAGAGPAYDTAAPAVRRGAGPEVFEARVPINIMVKTGDGQVLSRRRERQTITLVRKYQRFGEL